MILIQDGYMIDPKSGKEGNFDILIDGDKIVKIAEKIEPKGKVTRINAEGLLVAPGLVDVHVHFRDPGFTAKEDINTGAAAAAKGGVTTVVLMANTKPTVDSEETLKYILEGHENEGVEFYTPYEDRRASISSKDGKPVYARRSPHMDSVAHG